MRRHLFWSVAALAITLSIGEAYLPMAFLIPVVVLAYNPAAWRTAIKFLLLYGLMSLAYVAARLTFAPGRASGVADADKLELAGRILQAMYYGVSASLSSFGKRIGEFLGEANSGSLTIAFTVFVVLGCAFAFLSSGTTIRTQTQGAHGEAKPNAHARFYFAAFALLACAAAYPLYGMYPARFPPTIIDGKLSNIHGTAALGFSGLLASALSLIDARRQRARWLFVSLCVLVMAYESCLAGYFAVVQQRYAESWRYQLAFFRHLPEVAPTLHARSLVVVEPMGAEATRLEGGSPFDWTLPYLAQFVWRVPRSWPDTPLVINNYFFTTTSRVRGEFIDIVGYPTLPARTFLQRDIIRVRVKDGRLFSSERDKTYARDIGVPFWDEPQTTGVFRPGEFQLRAVRRRQEAQGLVTLVPNNYTGAGWHNGVMKVPGPNNDMFYFIVDDETLNPIHAGDTVQFATAGQASVGRVDIAKQDGRVSVFVQVNRDLDPNRDGFPNRVTVLSEPER